MSLSCAFLACDGAGPDDEPAPPPLDPAATPTPTPAASAAPAVVAPCPGRDPYKHVYFGDLHVHTSYSIDSYGFGNRNDPADAYRFARGASAVIAAGEGGTQEVTLTRALDFAAVTDHGEFLSVTGTCLLGAPGAEEVCADYLDQGSRQQRAFIFGSLARLLRPSPPPLQGCSGADAADCLVAQQTAWSATRAAAAAADEPCGFTSLIGYEWTATTDGDNLHRNVIFGSATVPSQPYDYLAYPTPRALWQALAAGCRPADGCDAITIPHNSNYSGGQMWTDADDDAVTRDLMARYQTLVEVYQHKAASECLPGSPLADDGCAFEYLGGGTSADAPGYVRDALAAGLGTLAATGVNPLRMGLVGATDTHNGTPGAVDEDAWAGHGGAQDDTPRERLDRAAFSPGGITAVWAPENTRAEIFGALKRRESYATSGPRIAVRTYALALPDDAAARAMCADPMFPKALVDAGAAPMGGDVPAATAPYLFVAAVADETPLASFDVVRLRTGASGQPESQTTSFSLGAGERQSFCRFWRDPTFVAGVPSLYYTRVLERATPRWSAYDCAAAPAAPACRDATVPRTIQERAWTSPIYVLP
ncbi:MAG: DUF3604 domain-containing protein [Kofleriaceae bacterium]